MAPTGFDVDLAGWFTANEATVDQHLRQYYGGLDGTRFTGRWFDEYAGKSDPHVFTAVDLIAVETLSVQVPPEAAATLLLDQAAPFNELLQRIPEDDLWAVDRSEIGPGSAADALHEELRTIPGIGWVTAGKLMAAKRPRLIPVYDSKVRDLINPSDAPVWESLHAVLSDEATRREIEQVCRSAPPEVTLLRRIDVALWMSATRTVL